MTRTPNTPMVVRYGSKFVKQFDKAGPKIQELFTARRKLFEKNPTHPQLRNHRLRGRHQGMHSINVTGDWRALYREHVMSHGNVNRRLIIFELLGTHSQLYK